MEHALRCGVSAVEFWELTPAETMMSIEAALWREERRQQDMITQAWLTAALSRAKRLPKLQQLTARRAKRLGPAELARREEEFRQMTQGLDLGVLNRRKDGDPTR